ncbi:Afadin [Fasciola gigantica]|uniref:Afadin n=1 Tax=Fasciola gigantica TaxID=46835 RepID=A0A504YGI3_FASGI|nr:Afadin [Fasciola gigantica]
MTSYRFFPLHCGVSPLLPRTFSLSVVRRLTNDEHPLLVQLNWSKLDREGKFVLKLETTSSDQMQVGNGIARKATSSGTTHGSSPSQSATSRIRRRWSVRKEKQHEHEVSVGIRPRRNPLGCAAAVQNWTKERLDGHSHHNQSHHHRTAASTEHGFTCLSAGGIKLHSPVSPGYTDSRRGALGTNAARPESPPDSSFTRTICNPEALMRRKRQRTLEAKLHQILQHGGPDIGGTLKIYGGQICPEVPYKTLLLSVSDTVADVIRQSLDKYGFEEADPDAYCLVMRTRTSTEVAAGLGGIEEILADTDCPLGHLFSSAPEAGAVVTFELRHRPPHLSRRRPFSESSSTSGTPYWNVPYPPATDPFKPAVRVAHPTTDLDAVFACLIEVDGNDTNLCTGNVFPLPVHKGQVCVGTALHSNSTYPHIVTLPLTMWPNVELRHLIIWRPPLPPGITASVAATDATTKRGGWLACRPCMRPGMSAGQPEFAQVYVNNQALRQTVENRHCVHWLAPGDILRLGHGPRALRIWPGDGSNLDVSQRLFPKFHPQLAEPPSPTVSAVGCPEVPRHQRLYASNLVHGTHSATGYTDQSQCQISVSVETSRSADVSSARALPVSYLSPLVQRVIPQVDRMHHGRTGHQDSSTEMVHSPFTSASASSSSLSSTAVTEVATSDVSSSSSVVRRVYASLNEPQYQRQHQHLSHDEHRSEHVLLSPHPSAGSLSPSYAVALVSSSLPRHCGDPPAVCSPSPTVSLHQPISGKPVGDTSSSSLKPQDSREDTSERALVDVSHTQTSAAEIRHHSRSPRSHQLSASKSSRSKSSTISDRLPCQLAFAPGTMNQLLDWIITHHLRLVGSPEHVSNSCPLGPAISVYLMLRAICRQCDRWEMIEARQNLHESIDKSPYKNLSLTNTTSSNPLGSEEVALAKSNLDIHQRRRRQRELLSLLVNAVERLQHFETVLIEWIRPLGLMRSLTDSGPIFAVTGDADPSMTVCTDPAVVRGVFRSVTAWLANASQLLHLITRDVDLCKAFEMDAGSTSVDNDPALGTVTRSAWTLVQEQLTDVVQAAFGFLSELAVSRLDRVAIPHLLEQMKQSVSDRFTKRDTVAGKTSVTEDAETENISDLDWFSSDMPRESDVTLTLLTETLDCMHEAYVNPAFTVQLFARLLHRLNARLFNFLLGNPPEEKGVSNGDSSEPAQSVRPISVRNPCYVSPAWGRVLQQWIHAGLCAWAMAQGLGTAVECYLQRVSQAAELMLADVSSVESLYNVTVDLVGLNSRQVRMLLENFVQSSAENTTVESRVDDDEQHCRTAGRIPDAWVEFVVSGVKLVADRILAEEVEDSPVNGSIDGAGDSKTWEPRLTEPLNLLLPLLLPEDSYPSDNPVPADPVTEEPTSLDSGISSRPGSAKEPANPGDVVMNREPVEALITVDSVRQFLTPAIELGWCRLSVRPIFDRAQSSPNKVPNSTGGPDSTSDGIWSSAATSKLLSWSVYLGGTGTPSVPISPVASQATTIQSDAAFTSSNPSKRDLSEQLSTDAPEKYTQHHDTTAVCDSDHLPVRDQLDTSDPKPPPPSDKTEPFREIENEECQSPSRISRSFTVDCIDQLAWCEKHRPLTVVVPKIGPSLGLSIVAARSEDGRDMGIYVRGVIPESGASQARLLHPTMLPDWKGGDPLLEAGDHLLAVNDQLVTGLGQEAAVQLVASCPNEVRLTVVRNPDIRAALRESTAPMTFHPARTNGSEMDPGCVECQLRASFQINPVTWFVEESVVSAPRKPVRVHPPPPPLATVMRPTLPHRDPPPVPSALGPVMHLSNTRQSNKFHDGLDWTSTVDNAHAFRSRAICSHTSGASVSVTYKPAFPRRTLAVDTNGPIASDPARPRVHPLKGYTSCSMNALYHAVAPNSTPPIERMLFPVTPWVVFRL